MPRTSQFTIELHPTLYGFRYRITRVYTPLHQGIRARVATTLENQNEVINNGGTEIVSPGEFSYVLPLYSSLSWYNVSFVEPPLSSSGNGS